MGEADSQAVLRVLDDEDDPERYAWAEDLDPAEFDIPDDALPQWSASAGGVADVITGVLAAGGDPAGKTDAELIDAMAGWQAVASMAQGRLLRETEELTRRRRPRGWDSRRERAESRREDLNAPDQGSGPVAGRTWIDGTDHLARPRPVVTREASAETALALTFTDYAARAHVELTCDLSNRLPKTLAEIDAGRTDLTRVKITAEYTQDLTDEDAVKADAIIAPLLGKLTTGGLRDKLRRLLASLDKEAAERRRKRSERRARFVLYGNAEGTATAAIERIPAAQGAAAKSRIAALARAYKAAGATEPLPLLEAITAVGLLLGTLPSIPPSPGSDPGPGAPGPDGTSGMGDGSGPDDGWPGPDPDDPGPGDSGQDGCEPDDHEPEGAEDLDPDGPGEECADGGLPDKSQDGGKPGVTVPWPRIPANAGTAAPGCAQIPPGLRPKDPGRIRLTAAWRSIAGTGPEAADLTWLGPVTPGTARDLATAAAADPSAAWHLIVTDTQGHAIAYTRLRTRRATAAPGMVSDVTLTITASLAAALTTAGDLPGRIAAPLARTGPAGTDHQAASTGTAELARLLAKAVTAANRAADQAARTARLDRQAGGCAHTRQSGGYRVPDSLRKWLNVRDGTCRNPICRQPASRCDQDHTRPHHQGGRTCPCNIGGECRTHHQLKQLPGWHLTQDTDGCFTWRTPTGHTYRKAPHRYPV
jgi:hypothetical protein